MSGTITGTGGSFTSFLIRVYPSGQADPIATKSVGGPGPVAFTVGSLPAGNYDVSVTGFGAAQPVEQWYDQVASRDAATPIAVTAGSTDANIDFTINAVQTVAVTGVVVAAGTALPIAGATIQLTPVAGSSFGSATTDETGAWTANVAPGTYHVQYAAVGFVTEYHLDQHNSFAADDLVVSAATDVGTTTLTATDATLSGTITDSVTGTPLTGCVSAFDQSAGSNYFDCADASGNYHLDIPASTYSVSAFGPAGYLGSQPLSSTPIPIGPTTLQIHLVRGTLFSGHVSDATTSASLSGISVEVYRELTPGSWTFWTSAATDANGNYTTSALDAAHYRIGFTNAAGRYVTEFFSNAVNVDTGQTLTAVNGTDQPNINAQLTLGSLMSGKITDSVGGAAVDDACVAVRTTGGDLVANACSTATGLYQTLGLPNGTFDVTVTATGFDPATFPITINGADLVHNVSLTHPATAPGVPTGVTGTPGNTQVAVTWVAPASNGGSAITGYTVTAAPGGATCTTTGALTCTVTGLVNGTAYTFTVAATNALGTSGDSGPSAGVTPRTVPDAPTGVGGVPGNNSVAVSWIAPAGNGGSTITGYTATAAPGGATCTTNGALTCNVAGLASGTAYTFTVRASNAAGPGAPSTASAPVTTLGPPATAPGAPTAVTGTPANSSVTVSWTAPSSNGGAPISGYTVTAAPGGATCTTSGAVSCTVATLSNGTPYTFTVTASNSVGASVASVASAAVTPRTTPLAPAKPTGVPGNKKVTLKWVAPANGGSPITDYVIQYRLTTTATWSTFADPVSTAVTAVVTPLLNGKAYVFRIAAKNASGTSTFGPASAAVTPRTVPSAPKAPTVSPRVKSAVLTWKAPLNGGSPITDYLVQFSSNNGLTWATFKDGVKTTLGATVTGLTTGKKYVFRIAAKSAAGLGPYSPKSLVVTIK